MSLADHPLIVPDGYRVVARFAWAPMVIAGRRIWLERYRVIQRQEPDPIWKSDKMNWEDVGYFDEVMPINKPVIETGGF